jgi:hypothetical protein
MAGIGVTDTMVMTDEAGRFMQIVDSGVLVVIPARPNTPCTVWWSINERQCT